ncbi:hypothetical protein D3C81_1821470 [compost metagenome]
MAFSMDAADSRPSLPIMRSRLKEPFSSMLWKNILLKSVGVVNSTRFFSGPSGCSAA